MKYLFLTALLLSACTDKEEALISARKFALETPGALAISCEPKSDVWWRCNVYRAGQSIPLVVTCDDNKCLPTRPEEDLGIEFLPPKADNERVKP